MPLRSLNEVSERGQVLKTLKQFKFILCPYFGFLFVVFMF